jgi:stringent starvation protein B
MANDGGTEASNPMSEISTKPYLLRAIYEWCTDNGYTPYLAAMVDAGTKVPREFVKNGEIVLNISFTATTGLKIENELVQFHARFGGVSRDISIPVENVVAIYARENGQGMAFEVARAPVDEAAPVDEGKVPGPALSAVPSMAETGEARGSGDVVSGPDGNRDPPKKGRRPKLTRIK